MIGTALIPKGESETDPKWGPKSESTCERNACSAHTKRKVDETSQPGGSTASHDPGLAINQVLSISCRFLGLALVNTKRSAVTIDRLYAITE